MSVNCPSDFWFISVAVCSSECCYFCSLAGSSGCATWRSVMTTAVCLAWRGHSYSVSSTDWNWRSRTCSTHLRRCLCRIAWDMQRWPVPLHQLRSLPTAVVVLSLHDKQFNTMVLAVHQHRPSSRQLAGVHSSFPTRSALQQLLTMITCWSQSSEDSARQWHGWISWYLVWNWITKEEKCL